jgi:hypothetical protein
MSPIFRLATLTATAFLSAAAATACSDEASAPTDSVPTNSNPGIAAGTLEAVAARPTLTLRNTTEFQVGFMVVDKDQMVVAMYPPCGDNCPKLVQGAQLSIPYSAIGGYTSRSTEAVVMWWTYTRQADGSLKATGAVQTKNIRL